jgi:hypothetical protein
VYLPHAPQRGAAGAPGTHRHAAGEAYAAFIHSLSFRKSFLSSTTSDGFDELHNTMRVGGHFVSCVTQMD